MAEETIDPGLLEQTKNQIRKLVSEKASVSDVAVRKYVVTEKEQQSDGSTVLVMSTGSFANRKRVILTPEDMQQVSRHLATSDDEDDDIPTNQGLDAGTSRFEAADAVSQLTVAQIHSLADGLTPSRRTALLRKMAAAEPFTQDDVDLIFGTDPETGQYAHQPEWDLFNSYVNNNLIVMRRNIGD